MQIITSKHSIKPLRFTILIALFLFFVLCHFDGNTQQTVTGNGGQNAVLRHGSTIQLHGIAPKAIWNTLPITTVAVDSSSPSTEKKTTNDTSFNVVLTVTNVSQDADNFCTSSNGTGLTELIGQTTFDSSPVAAPPALYSDSSTGSFSALCHYGSDNESSLPVELFFSASDVDHEINECKAVNQSYNYRVTS